MKLQIKESIQSKKYFSDNFDTSYAEMKTETQSNLEFISFLINSNINN